jgi:hypothetical protein
MWKLSFHPLVYVETLISSDATGKWRTPVECIMPASHSEEKGWPGHGHWS